MAKKLNRFLALESEAIVAQNEDGTEGQQSVTTTTDVDVEVSTTLPLQQELAEIAEDAAELDEMEEGIEEAEDVQEALESLHAMLGRDATAGGLSQESATYFQFALERELGRVGLRNTAPSCEAFGVSQSKLRATTLSQESVGTRIKEVWAMIVKMVTEFLAKVNEFIQTHISSAGRLVKSAKAVFEKAGKAKGDAKAKEMAAGSFTKLCDEKGAFPAANGMLDSTKSLLDYAFGVSSSASLDAMSKFAGELASVKTDTPEAFANSFRGFIEIGVEYASATTTIPYLNADMSVQKGRMDFLGPILPGGKRVQHTSIDPALKGDWKTNEGARMALMRLLIDDRVSVVSVEPEVKASYDKVPVATIDEVKAISKAAEEIGAAVVGFKTTNDKVQQTINKLKSDANSFASKVDSAKDLDAGSKEAAKSVLRLVNTLAKQSSGFAAAAVRYAVPTATTALNYAEKSLAQYAAE
jgi:hypothetical protein